MALEDYRAKRDFRKTSEPVAKPETSADGRTARVPKAKRRAKAASRRSFIGRRGRSATR